MTPQKYANFLVANRGPNMSPPVRSRRRIGLDLLARFYHSFLDSEVDSELSEEEDQFEDPKSFHRHGKGNMSIAVYENLSKRHGSQRPLRLKKPLLNRSGFKEINFYVSPETSNGSEDLPRLKIEIQAEYVSNLQSNHPCLIGQFAF